MMRDRKALAIVRVHGPDSCAGLARKANCDRERLYRALYRLKRKGLVNHLERALYDISDLGRERFADEFAEPLLRGQVLYTKEDPLD